MLMEVQIFGVKNNADVRKAERFFKERRITTHFVDFKQRSPSRGELQRFFQRFGEG
jgi:arsenate reductase-like glutaredoxin family protein